VVVVQPPRTEAYQPWTGRAKEPLPPLPPDLRAKADGLKAQIAGAVARSTERQTAAAAQGLERKSDGVVLEFESVAEFELALDSLENRSLGIELLSVTPPFPNAAGATSQRARVFVPDDQVKYFLKRIEAYATEKTKKDGQPTQTPRNQQLVQRIAEIRLATLRELWTDDPSVYPTAGATVIWEVWLRRTDGQERERLADFAAHVHAEVAASRLAFDDRIVVLVRATREQLASSVDVLGDIAELRLAKDPPTFFTELHPVDEAAWVQDAANRIVPPGGDVPAVCVLDTGVTRAHPLLERSLAPGDLHACLANWQVTDHDGHGTEMAGLALLGDLTAPLAAAGPIQVDHRLESVKILPPQGQNPPELYGARTAQASSLVEIAAPNRRRTFLMAVSSRDARDRGLPTSWSAAIDALAAGRSFDQNEQGLVYLDADEMADGRLFVLAAGNVATYRKDHILGSDLEVVHDPAHAWNALTVGAHTDRAVIEDDGYDAWSPLARPGDLSPYGSTSVSFSRSWPIKPDVVFEGGNLAFDGDAEFRHGLPSLSVLTTYYRPPQGLLVPSWATSAASAPVARMACRIGCAYPTLWPETVRGLIVSSARWTPRMWSYLSEDSSQGARQNFVRRFGFGVPDETRAVRSARDSLTLIAQSVIHPFEDGGLREIHLHDLPWPRAELARLGQAIVTLRVTLSYFIEPNPGRRGWTLRHSYASHGLRFAVKGALEDVDDFHARLNQLAHDEESGGRPKARGADANWFLGSQIRHRGSLHSDHLRLTAADLAERGTIAVYPVSGWWKEFKNRDRSHVGARYALIVSIETDEVAADIWTPVAQIVGVPIEA
jgi:hypothetical protein